MFFQPHRRKQSDLFSFTDSVWPPGLWRLSVQTVFIWANQCTKWKLRGGQARPKLIQTRNVTKQKVTVDADLAIYY